MGDHVIFHVRRAFLVPLGFLLLVQLTLLVAALVQDQPPGRSLFVGAVVLVLALVLAASLSRRIEVDTEGLSVWRFGARRQVRFADLTQIEAVSIRRRLFITLWVDESFLLVTNAYGDFATLFRVLLQRAPQDVISDEVRELAVDPPRHNGNIVLCWIAVAFSLLILVRQLLGGG